MIRVLLCALFVLAATTEDRDGDRVEDTSKNPSNGSLWFLKRSRTFLVAGAGASLSLNCNASGTPIPSILWEKDGVRVGSRKPRRNGSHPQHSNAGQKFVLRLRNVTFRDSGFYRCIVHNSKGAIQRNFTVTVLVSDLSTPRIDYITRNQSVLQGACVVLLCHVTTEFTANITWAKRYEVEHVNKSVKRTTVLRRSAAGKNWLTLKLDSVMPSDSAEYICTAVVPFGKSRRSTWLAVNTIDKVLRG